MKNDTPDTCAKDIENELKKEEVPIKQKSL